MVRKMAPPSTHSPNAKEDLGSGPKSSESRFSEAKYREYALKFGMHLRKLRKSRKMSQEELARRAGCNISFIGSIERGQKSPTLLTMTKIADGLGVHITELFYLAEERDEKCELREILEDRFFTLLDRANPETLTLLSRVLKSFLDFEAERERVN